MFPRRCEWTQYTEWKIIFGNKSWSQSLLCQQSSHLVAGWRDAGGRHVRAAHGLDLLHARELLVVQDLVEVDDDLVQEADALHTLAVKLFINLTEIHSGIRNDVKIDQQVYLVDILGVELREVGYAGEQHPGVAAPLCEQVLHPTLRLQVELRHVEGEQVLN